MSIGGVIRDASATGSTLNPSIAEVITESEYGNSTTKLCQLSHKYPSKAYGASGKVIIEKSCSGRFLWNRN